MFKFLSRWQPSAVLADCEKELRRTSLARWRYVSGERDMTALAQLLERAKTAGLAEHETVKHLDFLHRLLGWLPVALERDVDATVKDGLLAEAKRYGLENIDASRALAALRELELLVEHGVAPIGRDAQGRAVYLRCSAEFKNKPGQFEVREDGATFTGEVVVEIVWSNVVHAAKTTHTYQGLDYRAVAFQEGKRRTPTKFAFPPDHGDLYLCEVTVGVWEHSKKRVSEG